MRKTLLSLLGLGYLAGCTAIGSSSKIIDASPKELNLSAFEAPDSSDLGKRLFIQYALEANPNNWKEVERPHPTVKPGFTTLPPEQSMDFDPLLDEIDFRLGYDFRAGIYIDFFGYPSQIKDNNKAQRPYDIVLEFGKVTPIMMDEIYGRIDALKIIGASAKEANRALYAMIHDGEIPLVSVKIRKDFYERMQVNLNLENEVNNFLAPILPLGYQYAIMTPEEEDHEYKILKYFNISKEEASAPNPNEPPQISKSLARQRYLRKAYLSINRKNQINKNGD